MGCIVMRGPAVVFYDPKSQKLTCPTCDAQISMKNQKVGAVDLFCVQHARCERKGKKNELEK